MKIQKLNEKLYPVKINEDYESIEMEISDSDIHRYLDLKYDSEEIINLAQQFNPNIGNADLDAAYSEIINHFDELLDNSEFEDLKELQKYLDGKIRDDYEDDAELKYESEIKEN